MSEPYCVPQEETGGGCPPPWRKTGPSPAPTSSPKVAWCMCGGARSSLLIPREAGMRKRGGGPRAWAARQPSQLRESSPAASGMWKPIKGRRPSPRPPLRAPLPAPKHSRAPVTRAHRHTPTPDTRPLGCALRHTHTHPPPSPRTLKFHSSEGSWFSWQCRALGSLAQGGDSEGGSGRDH